MLKGREKGTPSSSSSENSESDSEDDRLEDTIALLSRKNSESSESANHRPSHDDDQSVHQGQKGASDGGGRGHGRGRSSSGSGMDVEMWTTSNLPDDIIIATVGGAVNGHTPSKYHNSSNTATPVSSKKKQNLSICQTIRIHRQHLGMSE